jgi:nucleoside-diphosphate kinase
MNEIKAQSPKEKCLVLLKPDCVERKLTGRFLELIETTGLKIIGLKMICPSEDLISAHYAADHTWLVNAGRKRWLRNHPDKELPETEAIAIGQDIRRFLIEGLSRHRIIAAVIEGANAIQYLRKLAGSTEPLSAEPGTLRGLYSTDSYEIANIEHRSIQNLIHVSDCDETAEREIKIWFRQDEIYE